MRIIERKGPFQTIDIFLENITDEEVQRLRRRYARVSILSYDRLDLQDGYRLKQKKTPNIYLSGTEDEIFHRFRDTVRNEIRRTEKLNGLEVLIPDKNWEQIYELYSRFELSQGRIPFSKSHLQQFVAASSYYNGKLLSSILCFASGDYWRVRSIFSHRLDARQHDRELYKIVGYATKRLVFELCKYAKKHDGTLLDLASINLIDPRFETIAHFKNGFGGKIEDEYQYTYSKKWFRLFELLAAARNAFILYVRRKSNI